MNLRQILSSAFLVLIFSQIDDSSQACTSGFADQYLARHNEHRQRHGAPPLTLNTTLSTYAQEWADHLLANGGKEHRNQSTYGENIFTSSHGASNPLQANTAVDWYYDEIEYYIPVSGNFSKEPNMSEGEGDWTHFTQVVWNETTQMGVACAIGSDKTYTAVVSNYSPKGNIVTKFQENVFKP